MSSVRTSRDFSLTAFVRVKDVMRAWGCSRSLEGQGIPRAGACKLLIRGSSLDRETACEAAASANTASACRFWDLVLAGSDFSDLEEFTGMCEPS